MDVQVYIQDLTWHSTLTCKKTDPVRILSQSDTNPIDFLSMCIQWKVCFSRRLENDTVVDDIFSPGLLLLRFRWWNYCSINPCFEIQVTCSYLFQMACCICDVWLLSWIRLCWSRCAYECRFVISTVTTSVWQSPAPNVPSRGRVFFRIQSHNAAEINSISPWKIRQSGAVVETETESVAPKSGQSASWPRFFD